MMLREVRYGIRVGLQQVSVAPLGSGRNFSYAIGALWVQYSAGRGSLALCGPSGVKTIEFARLLPNHTYDATSVTVVVCVALNGVASPRQVHSRVDQCRDEADGQGAGQHRFARHAAGTLGARRLRMAFCLQCMKHR
jgi:hypothetical protein